MEYLNWVIANWGLIYSIATSVVGTAALVAAATPTTKDDGVIAKIRGLLDFAGANFGNAKNAPK